MTSRPAPPEPLPESASTPRQRPPRVTRERPPGTLAQATRSMGTIGLAAIVIATLFTWWTPSSFLPAESAGALAVALATQSSAARLTPVATVDSPENRVGIVAGHRGVNPATGLPDPGAICADGLTEVSVNEQVAARVADFLRAEGYEVVLLDEFDSRLTRFQAAALVSIHADSCEFINDQATGYKVAAVSTSDIPDLNARLVACLVARYADFTGLDFHPSVTYDMTRYHTFFEIAPTTPGAIVEIGFLNLDRELLVGQPDLVAGGVADGILCFLRNEPVEGEVVVEEGQ